MFKMEFNVDGADLDNDSKSIADVLRRIADDVEHYAAGPIRDANGRLIGKWSTTKNYRQPVRDNPEDADWFGEEVNGLPTVVDRIGEVYYEEDMVWSPARGDWWFMSGRPTREVF